MDEKYKTWDINILPFSFTKIKLNTIANDGAIKQAKTIKELLLSDTVSEIVNACDADREGENIFRNIILGSNVKFLETVTFSRMWISSTTNDGIQDAFKNRHPLNEYKNLAISAKARAYADYHLGLNSTMAMTSSFKTSSKDIISVGRVQTPTLKMIERKLDDIENGKLTFADCLNYIFKLDKQLIEDIKEASKNDRNKISSNSNKILCKCPFCGSNIIEKEKFYCCENKECNTVIFKNQLERALGLHKITSSAAKDLFLRGKTTNKISGFISKNKKRYSAYLTYKKENNKNNVWISFE